MIRKSGNDTTKTKNQLDNMIRNEASIGEEVDVNAKMLKMGGYPASRPLCIEEQPL